MRKLEIDYQKIKSKDLNIIDIRTNYYYLKKHINNSINIEGKLLKEMPEKFLSKNKSYYLICESGYKSKILATYLNSLGYQTYSIKNGYDSIS